MAAKHPNFDAQTCLQTCLSCYQMCLTETTGTCLEEGGDHTEPDHIKLMLACAEVCRTTAHLLLLGSPHAPHLCAECADICQDCADSCEELGMSECAELCLKCADQCNALSEQAEQNAKAA